MRRQKRLQRLQEAVDRGEAEMPKPRARNTTGGAAAKRGKRKIGEVTADFEVAGALVLDAGAADCAQNGDATDHEAALKMEAAPSDAPMAQPPRRSKAARKGEKRAPPAGNEAVIGLDSILQGPPAFSPTREERMAQLAALLASSEQVLFHLGCISDVSRLYLGTSTRTSSRLASRFFFPPTDS